ncbi:MAG TPA: M15 family metallopeptidase [Acetobacteraceae bacterium]|nr:M15 family metallopeptidase [Acetobacteraceae bacterium]
MGNFYSNVISNDSRFHNLNRVADLNLLEPKTRSIIQTIIDRATQGGIPVMVFETFRSQERQAQLFAQGASTLKTVGVHHYGLACDIVKDINGEPSWKGDFSFLGKLAHSVGMIWGGDWGDPKAKHSFVDSDHVQRITLRRQDALFTGDWYPDDTYDPYRDH